MNEALLLKERALALLDCYEALLTEKQAAIMDAHHRCDLSLSEIAEQENVSRASVSDTLSKSLAKLEEFESKIGLLRKKEEISALLERGKSLPAEEKAALYEAALEELENGI